MDRAVVHRFAMARKGQMASNRKDDHEISMLCLHLLQTSMVTINTSMIQRNGATTLERP